ncbi:MAG: hypothetical protein ACOYKD_08195 [Anaerolineaceae bacterium]|jgi:hypothetical protein
MIRKSKSDNWLLLLSLIMTYALGVAFVSRAGIIVNWYVSGAGLVLLLFATLYPSIQNQLLDFLKSVGKTRRISAMVIFGFIMIGLAGASLFLLFRYHVFKSIGLLWFMLFLLAVAVANGYQENLKIGYLTWVPEAFSVSPISFLIAISLQGYDLPMHMSFLLLTLWCFYSVAMLGLMFQKEDESPVKLDNTLIRKIGWQKLIRLHHNLIGAGWLAFLIYLWISGNTRLFQFNLSISLFHLLQIFLLYRMSVGLKPNWTLIWLGAYFQYLAFVYMLIFVMIR